MLQRTRIHALQLIPCLASGFLTLGLLAQDQSPAPDATPAGTPPIKIQPHASRWDYPKEVTLPPGTQIHVVEKGDTLWDLGSKYLGNPFAWPQIWELNKWVKDPHWIYPGDALIVDGSRSAVLQTAKPGGEGATEEIAYLQPDFKRTPKATRDEFAFTFQDFTQMPFLAAQGLKAYVKQTKSLKIVNQEDHSKLMLSTGDVVFLDGGSDQGYKAGDRLVTYTLQQAKFYHPDDKHHRKSMGDILRQDGIVRITATFPKQSLAVVENSMDGIQQGHYAASFTEPAYFVTNLRQDTEGPVQVKQPVGQLIYIRDGRIAAGGGELVLVDQGSKAGLKVGDTLLIIRPFALDPSRKQAAKDTTSLCIGQLVVISTEEQTSTCRVLRSKIDLQIGDEFTR